MGNGGDRVISIYGPTAVGKTGVALALAHLLEEKGIEPVAVSADAFQLYRGLETISGAPSADQRAQLEHLLVGSHEVSEEMSAGRYAAEAHTAIDDALEAGRQPIVVGGSGLYMQAALTELEMRPPVAGTTAGAGTPGPGVLHRRLREISPEAAARIAPGDRYRTQRAVGLAEAGERADPGERFWEAPPRHRTLRFGLVRDREELYRRIDERVEVMVRDGAAEEVRAAQGRASATARRIIGFEDLLRDDIEEMKRRTRRYAKRQLTWARRIPGSATIDLSSTGEDEAAALVAQALLESRE